ncbi:head maturation protease, ClpP-related [Raineya sp.]
MSPKTSHLKYFHNATGDTATMRIYKEIGGLNGVQGQTFADELDYLSQLYKKINVRINSPGGSILEGYAIFSSIVNAKVPVHTYNDGIAASMAGVILMAGKKVFMADYAKLMLHNPHNNNPEPDAKEKKVLDTLKESLVKIYESRTKQDGNTIAEMMNQETWLSAQEALEKGFIDEIVSYPNKRALQSTEQNASAKDLYLYFNTILNDEPLNLKKMTDETKILDNFKSLLGLSSDASVKEAEETIKTLKAKAVQNELLLREIENLRAENEEFKKNIEEAKKANANNLVEDALAKGKIRATQKEQFLKLALADFDLAKETINSLSGHPRFSEKTNTLDERAKWKLSDYLKNDPDELERLKNEELSTYIALFKQEYGFVPD